MAFVVAAVFAVGEWAIVVNDDRPFGSPVTTDATVVRSSEDTSLVDVRFPWPAGSPSTTVESTTYVHHVFTFPKEGETVAIEVAADDPAHVRLAEDARSAHQDLPYLAGLVALPLAFAVARRWHITRSEELGRAPSVSYAMLAAVDPPHDGHRRWRLFLYPLDAQAGDDPVCALALVTLPSIPGGTFPVDVKGSPRAYGRVAVRAHDRLLWTRGRALPRATMPRPAPTDAWPPRAPVTPRAPTATLEPVPTPWFRRLLMAAGLVLLLATQAVDDRGRVAQEDLVERSRFVTATVVRASDPDSIDGEGRIVTEVRFTIDGRDHKTTVALPDAAGTGTEVAVRVDPTDPEVVWAATTANPVAASSFLLTAALVGGAGCLALAQLLARRERVATAAHQLLRVGETTTFPVAEYGDLALRGGRLVHPASARAPFGPRRKGLAVRFEPDGLVAIDAGDRERVLGWPDRAWPRGWWFDGGPDGGVPTLHLPEPIAVNGGWLGRGSRSAETLAELVAFAERVPAGRAGFGDATRTSALIALLAGGAPRAEAFAILVDRDDGRGLADPPSAAPSG